MYPMRMYKIVCLAVNIPVHREMLIRDLNYTLVIMVDLYEKCVFDMTKCNSRGKMPKDTRHYHDY